ncbi:LysR family transcriptional regulator [Noviherbaspirillum galbum]|uniref:LysR family transcriptional regulator n=1 Tax=Noviherbaspirillum galbum TaxID=2709383 RepID=A0A6B3SX11_9BURK|nr:LysR family transcriptional regulator [Noviherbaspirillum galbum]NEX62309.1 LysR family transcriptional regulator [Noviherbaspirillum galbum]
MSDINHITLEQWRTLVTVVDMGGYAQAADALHKSQSSVTYAVQKIESQLGIKVFEMQGRKAMLTATGRFLYRRAKGLLDDSLALERAAGRLSAGWEAEIRIAVEILYPTWLLLDCLARFGAESPHTRIELYESVLNGTTEALSMGVADLAIAGQVPPGFLGQPLIRLRAVPVASPDHALHRLGRPLGMDDLRQQRHLVVRESGSSRKSNVLPLDASQRWTVSHSATSIEAVKLGHGFAWFPVDKIRNELAEGSLKALPLKEGGERFLELYLILADPDAAGPGTLRLADILMERTNTACEAHRAESGQEAQ